MKLKLTNKQFTKEQIKEVVRFVKPNGVSNFDIYIKNLNRSDFGGRAYIYRLPDRKYITVRIGRGIKFPYHRAKGGGYLPIVLYSYDEVLVYIIAHELRHLWHSKHPKGWRVWGSRGKYSERDACAYGIQKVRQWRRNGVK